MCSQGELAESGSNGIQVCELETETNAGLARENPLPVKSEGIILVPSTLGYESSFLRNASLGFVLQDGGDASIHLNR